MAIQENLFGSGLSRLGEIKMFFLKKKLFFLFIVNIFIVSFASILSAQEEISIVNIGQDRDFEAFNLYDSWFENDPNNPPPWPEEREAYAENDTAFVSLTAESNELYEISGVAEAFLGIFFEWDFGIFTWDEAELLPVVVHYDFEYSIDSQWTGGTGSANAWITFSGVEEPWYDGIGYENANTGNRGYRHKPGQLVISGGCYAYSIP